MEKIERIVSNVVFFLLCMLAILLLFEQYVQIPFWLQPIGRMHPLILHFPIGFVVLLVLVNVFRKQLDETSYQKVNKFLLLLTALTTTLASIMGFFLSREDGYTSDLMSLHKWLGAAVSYIMYALILTYDNKKVYQILLYSGFLCIVLAGHFGAGLTHGTDFLTEPIFNTQKAEFDENSPIFTSFVQPIFKAKCESCHNEQKQKGKLDLTTLEKIHKGGENGPVWIAGDIEESELIRRALLPLEDEDHMPPKGKPQLTDSEFNLIKSWIAKGADETISLAQLSEDDTLYILANIKKEQLNYVEKQAEYTFGFADEDLIASLNNPYRTVAQQSPNSPAIDVNIYGRQAFKPNYITELKEVKDQVVSLNLAYLPVQDDAIDAISKLSNLEKLNLNFTEVTGKTLPALAACSNLSSLSLSGTRITADISAVLEKLENLRELYIWNTPISSNEIKALQTAFPKVRFEVGYDSSGDESKINPPTLSTNKTVISKEDKISLEHKLKNIEIRYTLDGTDPDSTSTLYTEPLQFESYTTLKARAFKENWFPSDIKTYHFYVKGITPKKATLVTKPADQYPGKGAITLIDNEKGEANNISSPSWLGYRANPFSATVDLGTSSYNVEKVVMSYAVNIGQYIMAPTSIELWGGNSENSLALINKSVPDQDDEYAPNEVRAFSFPVGGTQYRYYKVVAHPLKVLPDWHAGKGDRGWVFVDELFFY
ncbi:chitobiase/beta-hexosaminidase C-terminal domain-containing protein [Reichenbachiella sp. MALMAid0571]|uniref:FN3 associated domain-containing protein n=1 Tax=Reichenbachiella sp. MALMAid0571 TaxID=3143939 RepID=UPI0032DFA49C